MYTFFLLLFKVTELQCDLLELRDAHAKLRTANEKLRRDKERHDREREQNKLLVVSLKRAQQVCERESESERDGHVFQTSECLYDFLLQCVTFTSPLKSPEQFVANVKSIN